MAMETPICSWLVVSAPGGASEPSSSAPPAAPGAAATGVATGERRSAARNDAWGFPWGYPKNGRFFFGKIPSFEMDDDWGFIYGKSCDKEKYYENGAF